MASAAVCPKTEVPHAGSITARNMEAAFGIGSDEKVNWYQRKRIRAWGEHYHMELRKLGAVTIRRRVKRNRRARHQRQRIA